jgi:hypothetical protein
MMDFPPEIFQLAELIRAAITQQEVLRLRLGAIWAPGFSGKAAGCRKGKRPI